MSVVVCTRDRGSSVAATIESILASAGVLVDLVVVDQSAADDTEQAVTALADQRLRYIRSSTTGLSRARNIGIRAATNEIVLITDDDVTVDAGWARRFAAEMRDLERVAVGFCRVDAADHDETLGFIPAHPIERPALARSLLTKSRVRGIGAGMAVRRDAVLAIGGFDEQLGAGAPLRSAEDRDLAMRALTAGWWVYQTPDASVVHHGFRSWSEGRELTRRDWYGIGAAFAKQLRCRRVTVVAVIAHEVIYEGFLKAAVQGLVSHGGIGARRVAYFAHGLATGLRLTVDPRTHVFTEVQELAA